MSGGKEKGRRAVENTVTFIPISLSLHLPLFF